MENKFNIKELQWKDVRADVLCFEPELAKIIDELDPKFPVFKLSYHYGAKIFENGIFHIPTADKQVLPITDPNIPTKIKEQLGYNSLPLGFVLEHGIEIYADLEDIIFSLNYFKHGLNLGIWEMFFDASPFTVSAGARSIFMLPKICEVAAHKKLKACGVKSHIPLNYFDHWKIFTEIANHETFPKTWSCDILFFSAEWMKKIKSSKTWCNFYNFSNNRLLEHIEYRRDKIALDIVWGSFSKKLTQRRLKPNLHIVDALKHLLFVAAGVLPAYAPAVDNQAAPVDNLIKVYFDVYGLKNYFPSIMQPQHLVINKHQDAVYYSLQIPCCMESSPRFRVPGSARSDLIELITVSDLFIQDLLGNELRINDFRRVYNALQRVEFNYFHTESNIKEGIYPSSDLPKEDKRFLYLPKGYKKREFCGTSTFSKGCVRISNKFSETE